MNVHVLQHVPFEGIGSMEPWLAAQQANISYTRFYQSAALPAASYPDLVIAMGGPMSVNDEDELPWLKQEKQFLREVIERGVPVVGICLGAQLIASALGARIYGNPVKEIGWFDIKATAAGLDVFQFPKVATVFHWHGETFDLPAGAIPLARSAACINQAFQLGANVIGLQFHLETTPASADAIIEHCRHELRTGAYIQSEAVLRQAGADMYQHINQLMAEVLAYVTRQQ